VSNLEDSRVLSAFSAQQNALPYMINVEQRIGSLNSEMLTTAKASDVATIQSQVAAIQATDVLQDASIATLQNSYGNMQKLLTYIDPVQTITSTSYTLVAGGPSGSEPFDLSITVSKASSQVLVMFDIPDVDSYSSGITTFAIREGSGSYREVSRIFNMSGRVIPAVGFIVFGVGVGTHQFRLYAKVSSGHSVGLSTGGTAAANFSASFLVSQIK